MEVVDTSSVTRMSNDEEVTEESTSEMFSSRTWGKVQEAMRTWPIYSKQKSWSESEALKSSESEARLLLTNYLKDLSDRMSDMCQDTLLIEQSRLKDVKQFLDVECRKAEVNCLESRLSYLKILQKMNLMHWALTEDGNKCDDDWIRKKLRSHYVLKFEDACQYVLFNDYHLRSKLCDLQPGRSNQRGDINNFIRQQKECAKGLPANQTDIRKMYQEWEEDLAFVMSRVDDSEWRARFLSDTHSSVRALLGNLDHYLGRDFHQGSEDATPTPAAPAASTPSAAASSTPKTSTDKDRNYGVIAGVVAGLGGLVWHLMANSKKPKAQE